MIQKIKNYILLSTTAVLLAVPALVPMTMGTALAEANLPPAPPASNASSSSSSETGCNNGVTQGIAKGASESLNTTGDSNATGVNCNSSTVDGTQITKIARTAVNLFSIVVGAVAVLMIIYGGFRYITSGGDSGNVGNAKNTLIYAIVGLIIVALAQIIVQFVLSQSSQIST